MELRDYQLEAIERIERALARGVRRQLGVAATGLGKALPTDELVLTPGGWATMGDLRVGDEVIGGDGCPVAVVGVFPQGVRPVVEVEFSDGARVRCDRDHLWAVRDKYDVMRERPWRVVRTDDIDMTRRWRIPIVGAVQHSSVALPLDPYLLGILLGDGGLSVPGCVLLHTEHALAATLELPAPCTLTKLRDDGLNGIGGTYIIGGPVGRGANPVLSALRLLGLEGQNASTKRVPWLYTVASADDRLALLRGIMDADGHVRPSDNHVELTLANQLLADDVAALVRSLGGTARVHHKATSWVHQGERRDGDAWRLSIAMPVCPFRWKASRWHQRTKYPPTRHIVSIRPVADAECVCIKVASDDGLFVVRDYVVTHNTVIFTALARRWGVRTLVLAHRDELIEQAAAKVREVWPEATIGIVKGDRDEIDAHVVVASVQTLARERRLARLLGSDGLGFAAAFGLVIVDEAHHSAAQSYRSVLDGLRCGADDGPVLLGVTATPDRGDGRGLDDLFDEVTFAYDLRWGIAREFLSDLRGLRVRLAADMGSLKLRGGDYDVAQAGAMLEAADAPSLIARSWIEHARDRRTLVFTPTVAVAEQVAAAFEAVGVPAGTVDGAMPIEQRRAVLTAFSRGEISVLANCQVLTEGYDEPRTDCVVIARPTKSRALYTQMVGRGCRLHPEKSDCLVIDVVGASDEHDLVTVPSLFGIERPNKVWDSDRTVTDVLREQVEQHAVEGRLLATEARLFDKVRAGRMAWVRVHDVGAERRRYELGLRTRGSLVLQQMESGNYLAGWRDRDGTKRVLIADVMLETAQGVAEDMARKLGDGSLTATDAAWRSKRPTAKQRDLARRFGIELPTGCTKGEASDLITQKIAQKRERRRQRVAV